MPHSLGLVCNVWFLARIRIKKDKMCIVVKS
jgi:hypothetical protein